jgi:polyisoprenyl-teichoic acid--peptidoglycan teichoic acid transferase
MSKRGAAAGPPRRSHRWVWAALIVLPLLVATGYGAFVLLIRISPQMLPGNEIKAPDQLSDLPGLAPAEVPTERINILVMGIDHRPGKPDEYGPKLPSAPTDPGRSDTMAVVSINPQAKSISVLNIPRDFWLEVPDGRGGWGMDRINEPYHTGEIRRLPGGGGLLAAQAITHNFGIPIDYYVDVDFNGFMALTDALGGIDVEVPNSLTATVLPRANTGAYEYTFFPGRQHLNGELALAYSRFRLNDQGDLGRIKRQQAVALAARQRLQSLGWIDHPLDVWQRYSNTLQTNIPALKLPGLALLAKQIPTENVTARSVGEPGTYREAVIPGSGADVLFPNPDAVARIVSEAFPGTDYGAVALAQLQREFPTGRSVAQDGSAIAAVPTQVVPSGQSGR